MTPIICSNFLRRSDIDECQANNGGCQGECINHDGSFSCRCTSTGFSLAADGKTCVCKCADIKEEFVLFNHVA